MGRLSAKTTRLKSSGVRLHDRGDLHIARKLWHMATGLSVVGVYEFFSLTKEGAITILGTMLVFNLLMEYLRLKSPAINQVAMRFWGPIMRDGEEARFSGVPYYLASAILVIGAFPEPVALLSLLYLACGDPTASFFGVLYGSKGPRFPNGKSLIGTSAAVVVCALLTMMFLPAYHLVYPADSPLTYFAVVVIGSLAGGFAEMLPFDMDDNFTIPVVSGFVLWLAFIVFSI